MATNGEKMFDPTQTQPLSWRMHDGQPKPWGEVPMDPPNRQAPSFEDSPPDRLSEGGFRLRGRIGSGRLGAIYEAQDELSRISGSRHFVATQLLDDRITMRPGFEDDFERGAMELKSVAHPNIVRLLEYGRDRNRFYLVNELLESASLRFVLNDAGVLALPETTAVLRAVGDALQYLHAKGMVHGNLRPEHVLVTFGYEVKLLDIVPTGWLLGPTDALGVPARAPDKRDDVFGLGCLAYEMLSGRHPFNGNTAQEAYRAGLEAEPIEGLTDPQWRALAGALAVHRDDRTPSVTQFLDEFGVASAQKLKSVVAAANEPAGLTPAPAPAYPAPTYTAADPPPAFVRPVVAGRAAPARPERRGVAGQLVLLFLVIGGGFAAWYYQEPLRQFTTDLMAEVETQMNRETTTASVAAPTPETPLAQGPTVTDDAPAMVLAPGATAPAVTEPEPAAPQANDSRASDMTTAPVTGEPVAATPEPLTQPAPKLEATAPKPAPAIVPPVAAAPAPAVAPGPARFDFAQPTMTVREGDVAARITIRRSGDLSKAAEVSWWTQGGTAVADADYADLGARVERFAPGEASRTVFVPLTNDSIRESAKSFSVLLGRGAGEIVSRTQVNIADDD
jgi:Protein kinase domain/Calx-beta domain